jgi:hypothetical protein
VTAGSPVTTAAAARPVDEPRRFRHPLPDDLLTPDRLDEIVRTAPPGKVVVQLADAGRERLGQKPVTTEPRYPIVHDVCARPVMYRIFDPHEWAGDDLARARDLLLEREGLDPALGRHGVWPLIRVFSPGAEVAYHGDPDMKLVAAFTGRTVWHVRPATELTAREHEDLLHGGFFLPYRASAAERSLELGPGDGAYVPSRWPHWLTHPCEEPVLSYELGFWTTAALRDRKVYDMNYLLRRLHLPRRPPGGPLDGLKARGFDLATFVLRKPQKYRGIH